MPSNAYGNLADRLKDIDQLMTAHSAVVRIRRANLSARRTSSSSSAGLSQAITALNTLVGPLTPGRVAEVESLNRGAIVLLSAHLEGYLEDLYGEAASNLLQSRVKDVASLVADGKDEFRNPQPGHIERLFRSIGIPKILDNVRWQKASNDSVRRRLTEYTDLRNKIAHGNIQISIRKSKVKKFTKFVKVFAEKFDEKVRSEIESVTGQTPWPQ